MLRLSASLLCLVLAMGVSVALFMDDRETSMGTLNATLTFADGGTAPGDVTLVVETTDAYTAPTFRTCWTMTLDGDMTLALTSSGEAYFGASTGDVNTALQAAMDNALAASGERTHCDNECFSEEGDPLESFGQGIEGDCTASVWLSPPLPSVAEEAEGCPAQPPRLRISVTAPPVTGWDVRDFIAGVDPNGFPDEDPATIQTWKDALLAMPEQIAAVYSPTGFLLNGPDGWQVAIEWLSASSVRMAIGLGGFYITAIYTSDTDITAVSDDDVATLDDAIPEYETNTGFPAWFEMTYQVNQPRTITDEIILLTSPETDAWESSGDSTHFTAGNQITVAFSEYLDLVDPGEPHSGCVVHWTFKNRHPWLGHPKCRNEMQLVIDADHLSSPTKKPPCRIWLRGKTA